MKVQDTEPNMGAIICWYIKGNGRKLCKQAPHLPMELSYESKAQDNIGWYNMMQDRISHYWTKWKSDYLKEGTFRKTGLN